MDGRTARAPSPANRTIDNNQSANLICQGNTLVVGSDCTLAPLLERFTRVTILDSTTLTLPDAPQEQGRGCGGS